jgi:hypothetical protein
MRDLTSRLREIVRRERGDSPSRGAPPAAPGELVYVPDSFDAGWAIDDLAARLGGTCHHVPGSACVVVDRVWEPDAWHGRRRVETFAIDGAAPLSLLAPALPLGGDWASRVVFFDIETTGLGGGAGTIAFLAGFGWSEAGAFRVRQILLYGVAGERALLDATGGLFAEASLVVTFNGRLFDLPFMETRWAFHRRDSPAGAVPHFDLLPPARRLWGRRRDPGSAGLQSGAGAECTLPALERSVLGFHRLADVPGMEIPSRYFQFLRTGEASLMQAVLDHNAHDLVSLAALTAHALDLAADGPEACRDAREQLALGRLYERAGQTRRAARAYDLAAADTAPDVRSQALARLAVLLRREARYEESAAAWQGVLESAADDRPGLTRLAAEALAIHHEHRARDLGRAARYANVLRAAATGRAASLADHRLRRLARKMQAEGPASPPDTPLLADDADRR